MRKLSALALAFALLAAILPTSYAQSRARRVGDSQQQQQDATKNAPPTNSPSPNSSSSSPSSAKEVREEVGDDEVVRVNTTLVSIPVSILDRDGRYISDVRKEEFRIFEDGVEQEVAYFATVEQPFTVALIIDTSGSTQFRLEDIQDAAIAFVDQLRPEDRVMVVSFDDGIKVHAEATSDRRQLRNAIRRTETGGGTRLYDAVDFVMKKKLSSIKGRKAIVLFTDGVDTSSKRNSYDSTLRDAEELDALIYPIQYDTYGDMNQGGVSGGGWPPPSRNPSIILPFPLPLPMPGPTGRRGGIGTGRGDYARAGAYLRDLAWKTGGRIFEANDLRNVDQAFSSIAEELRRQYSLGFYTTNQSKVSGRRQLKVRVKRPNLVVRARDSYIYKPSGNATTASEENERKREAPPEFRRPFAKLMGQD